MADKKLPRPKLIRPSTALVKAGPRTDNMGRPIAQDVVDRIVSGVTDRLLLTGAPGGIGPGWMSPLQPIPPMAPEKDVKGRLWDFPVGINVRQIPRQEELLSFEMLRGLAESCDILRVILEKRKDQIESVDWEIVPKDGEEDTESADMKRVTDFFMRPSSELDWDQWLRVFMDDLLVCDGVALYPRFANDNSLFSMDVLDIATIKRVIDLQGRTPIPPQPAYQQRLKGIPAVNYSSDELYYVMRNPRSYKLYGYSPVEWAVTIINTSIRKSLHQLEYFTEGSVPDALASLPTDWTIEQVKEFQLYWDLLLAGETGMRRKLRFVPFDSSKIHETKQVDLKDMFDEWLARVFCFTFGISPSFLVRDQTRATAQVNASPAEEHGLLPILRFLKARFDYIIHKYLQAPDVEWRWKTDAEIEPLQQAQIDTLYIQAKVLTPDEVRQDRFNKAPLTDKEKEQAGFNAPMQPVEGADGKPAFGRPGDDGVKPLIPTGAAPSDKPKGGQPPKPSEKMEDGTFTLEQVSKIVSDAVDRVKPQKVVVAPTIHVPMPEVHVGPVTVENRIEGDGAVRVNRDDGTVEED